MPHVALAGDAHNLKGGASYIKEVSLDMGASHAFSPDRSQGDVVD